MHLMQVFHPNTKAGFTGTSEVTGGGVGGGKCGSLFKPSPAILTSLSPKLD